MAARASFEDGRWSQRPPRDRGQVLIGRTVVTADTAAFADLPGVALQCHE
jgi:hypothetical protein